MADHRARTRGWHPDPADPTSVRLWDGHSWQRVRNRPAWSLTAGDLVVDTEGLADPARPGGPPVVEGPVRPAPERATTSALNVGGEVRSPVARPAPLRSRAATTGPRAGHFSAAGAAPRPVPGAPWNGSRKPMAILGLMVVAAVIAMAAIVGWAGPQHIDPGPLPSSFVAQATKDCTHTLGQRPSSLPTSPSAIRAEANQLSDVGNQLRALAIADHGNLQANGWLDTWADFTQTERYRAAALSQPGATDPSTLALAANDDAAKADRFAAANGVGTCSILADSTPAMQAIPS